MTSKHKHIPEEAMSEPRNPTSMLNITDSQCKYPLGDILDKPKLFCGRKRHTNYSYCAYHLYITTKQE
jgi:hypothetical protein